MNNITQLAKLVGFHSSYTNSFGEYVQASDQALKLLLSAMGYDLSDQTSIQKSITQLTEKQWRY
jgi:4-alpha-glucanotransferase